MYNGGIILYNEYVYENEANALASKLQLPLLGTCRTCTMSFGVRVYPCLSDIADAVRQSYLTCKPCFNIGEA